MVRKNLKAIIRVSFQKSEHTNFEELRKTRKWGKLLDSLGPDDVVCLVSTTETQLVFLSRYMEVSIRNGTSKKWRLLPSQRVRVIREKDEFGNPLLSTWEPKMVANYARQAGIELNGLRMFEDYYEKLTQ